MPDIKLLNPCHVGEFIREEILMPLNLNITDAAKILGVTRPALSNLLNEKAALSSEMAIRINKAFGVSFETLMRMQNNFEIANARRLMETIEVNFFRAA